MIGLDEDVLPDEIGLDNEGLGPDEDIDVDEEDDMDIDENSDTSGL